VIDYVRSSLDVVGSERGPGRVRLNLVCGDGTRMPFPRHLRRGLPQGLLEHFRDPGPLLQDNRRVLRRGGHVVIDVPNAGTSTRWEKVMIA